jgi:Tetratricopeptide repeat/Excalibur calcium-binding domain
LIGGGVAPGIAVGFGDDGGTGVGCDVYTLGLSAYLFYSQNYYRSNCIREPRPVYRNFTSPTVSKNLSYSENATPPTSQYTVFSQFWLRWPLLAALLTLVSCSGEPSPPPTAAVSPTPTAVSSPKPDPVALNNQGVGKMQKQDYEGAISDFSTAIKLKPDLVEAYLSRGVAHSLTKNHKAAIADYTKALKLKPTRADAYLNCADDLFVLGDKAKAIADLKQAKTLFTKTGDAKNAKEAGARLVALQLPKVEIRKSPTPTDKPATDKPASPTPTPEPTEEAVQSDTPSDYIEGNCGDLAAMGLGQFRPGDPNYTARRDRDGDGIACE